MISESGLSQILIISGPGIVRLCEYLFNFKLNGYYYYCNNSGINKLVNLRFQIRICEYMFNDLTDTDINFALRHSHSGTSRVPDRSHTSTIHRDGSTQYPSRDQNSFTDPNL
jgi:hypothetical protein